MPQSSQPGDKHSTGLQNTGRRAVRGVNCACREVDSGQQEEHALDTIRGHDGGSEGDTHDTSQRSDGV
jgi:hypothetical protein